MPDQMPDHPGAGAAIPLPALWLGAAGLIPFTILASALHFTPPDLFAAALRGLLGYGAVILSFLGGIIWGLTARWGKAREEGAANGLLLAISVVPPLLGWAALILEPRLGLFVLIVSFIAMLAVDLALARRHLTPAWYPQLRLPLTAGVTAMLAVAAFA